VIKEELLSKADFVWLPLLGLNHATTPLACSLRKHERFSFVSNHDVLPVQAEQRKEKEKQTACW
jgi:hypothetical protein